MSEDPASNPSKPKKFISRLFRSKSSSKGEIYPSDSVSVSNQPLVAVDHVKEALSTQQETFADLMKKAKTTPPEEFRRYLKEYKEKEEAKHRKFGGGIAGGGDWVWRGEKEVRGDYIV